MRRRSRRVPRHGRRRCRRARRWPFRCSECVWNVIPRFHPGHENRCICGFTARNPICDSVAGSTDIADLRPVTGTVHRCGSTKSVRSTAGGAGCATNRSIPNMSVNDPRGPSVDSRTTERRAKAKRNRQGQGQGHRPGAARPSCVQHRQRCRRSRRSPGPTTCSSPIARSSSPRSTACRARVAARSSAAAPTAHDAEAAADLARRSDLAGSNRTSRSPPRSSPAAGSTS